jgi:hypothetical protein
MNSKRRFGPLNYFDITVIVLFVVLQVTGMYYREPQSDLVLQFMPFLGLLILSAIFGHMRRSLADKAFIAQLRKISQPLR